MNRLKCITFKFTFFTPSSITLKTALSFNELFEYWKRGPKEDGDFLNQHEEVMAQKNLELSQLRYQYFDKEIQLAKIRSTLAETTSTNTSNTIESSKFNTSYRTKILSKIPHYNSPSMPTTKNVTLANLIKIKKKLIRE